MKRSEFNQKVRSLTKRILSSKTSSISLTKHDKDILLYSFYFALKYEDKIKRIKQLQNRISDAEACFADKGESGYSYDKSLKKAGIKMGWSKGNIGKQSRFSPEKERKIIDKFRSIRAFNPDASWKEAIERVYKLFELDGIEYESKDRQIRRWSKKYPDKLTNKEANDMAPDPDQLFEDLDIMIHELITS